MVEEGVLEAAGRRVDAAYGMHVFSALEPYGRFATKPGTMLAASDAFAVTFRGKGGHGSAPHGAKDPVPAAAELVTALQTTVTREFSIFDPIVVTVGAVSYTHLDVYKRQVRRSPRGDHARARVHDCLLYTSRCV